MNKERFCLIWLSISLLLLYLAACAPAQAPQEVVKTVEVEKEVVLTQVVAEEPGSEASPTARPPAPLPTPTPYVEERTVELEWPKRLSLGESDIVRLALIPSEEGYVAKAEFEEHPVETKDVPVRHAPGYTLLGIARLDGVGFEISPRGDQPRILPVGEPVIWRWTLAANKPGQQRISISLMLRWEPEPGVTGPVSETLAFGRGLNVQVDSLLGMTKSQAVLVGVLSLLFGSGLSTLALVSRGAVQVRRLRSATPNRRLTIEAEPGIKLSTGEVRLLQALFARYQRLVLEAEFKSGYSGARAFLAHPAWADGRADAATIAKVGSPGSIQAEYENYEQFVKDRLPPVTARIQHTPVTLRGEQLAGLQYTFIAEPGHRPLSLRQALMKHPDPAYLRRLFATFGPNWWMQRQPYTFLAGLEYDRLLPPHWVVEPAPAGPQGQRLEMGAHLAIGAVVRLPALKRCELRLDGASWALESEAHNGQPGLRIRWLSAQRPSNGDKAVIQTSRLDLLREWTKGYELLDLPDPLMQLEDMLGMTVQGTRSTIHGDLNLENILVGPGDLVWLIDFAATREGHPLLDFAHLGAEIIAHILSHQCQTPERCYEQMAKGDGLLSALEEIARRCLFDPACPQEFYLAQALACLGALKYTNLGDLEKRCLYLAAAYQTSRL